MSKWNFQNFSFLLFCLFLTSCSSLYSSGEAGGPGFSDEDLALRQAARFGGGNIPAAEADGLFEDIRFSYDSAIIAPEYQAILRKSAEVLVADRKLHAEVEGHCDSRGTNEYNLALGEERARAVAKILVSFGVSPTQLSTISYGEEIPLDSRQTEEAYEKNRRVHFALYRMKDK